MKQKLLILHKIHITYHLMLQLFQKFKQIKVVIGIEQNNIHQIK